MKSKSFLATFSFFLIIGIISIAPYVLAETYKINNSALRIVDNFGNPLTSVKVNQPLQITSDLTSLQNIDQPFAFDVKIFKDGMMISHSWITGTLTAYQSLSVAQSWTPPTSGTYTAQISILASSDSPIQLAQPLSKTIVVDSQPAVVLGQQMYMNPMNQNMQNQSAMNTTQGMSAMSNMKNMTMSQMMYDIMVGGKSFKVMVLSNGDLPKGVQFNQDQKTISFDGSGLTTKDLSHYEVTIPDVLLSGNFTVTIDDKSIKSIAVPNETSTTIHINIPSSYVKENSIGDSATITLAGTTAIPEFPFAILILASTVGFIIIITRKNLINSKVHLS